MRPPVGLSIRVRRRRSVDFPAPFGPTMPRNWFLSTSKVASASIVFRLRRNSVLILVWILSASYAIPLPLKFRLSRNTKKGTPIKEVIIPRRSSWGLMTVLAIRSATGKNMAPAMKLAGRSRRWSTPIMSLTECGIISPTNPTIPLTATLAPTIREQRTIRCPVVFSMSTPRVLAVS